MQRGEAMIDRETVKQYVESFQLGTLLRELGWTVPRTPASTPVSAEGNDYILQSLANNHGVQIFLWKGVHGQPIPKTTVRRTIDNKARQLSAEHLIVFVDGSRTRQLWQWMSNEHGQPHYLRSYLYERGQSSAVVAQRLREISFSISDEENLTLLGVVVRVKDALSREQATQRFYVDFKSQRVAFAAAIDGIPDQKDREWYAAVTLNRLMFTYFVQEQGFLNSDLQYLRSKLNTYRVQGSDAFYEGFLKKLFFSGFAKRPEDRPPEVVAALGGVPYLNGGLFAEHDLERRYPGIAIPNGAFESVLDFLHQYQWTLDDRGASAWATRSGADTPSRDEINPDVLGYIFEKYVNVSQSEAGAYYTKEDVTEYMVRSSIIPAILDKVEAQCPQAFRGSGTLWHRLAEERDYSFPSLRRGLQVTHGDGRVGQMVEVESQLASCHPDEGSYEWSRRLLRYQEQRAGLAEASPDNVDALVTLNVDIRQFAHDLISECDDPRFLLAFFNALSSIKVLDPTCGSGAFLLAALNVISPLYRACLDRMQAFVDDAHDYGLLAQDGAVREFRGTLDKWSTHANREYSILKHIIVESLYGVDNMREATEICRLRLFLKLVAQLEPGEDIEPLPDIDFNVRVGNTLVGYVGFEETLRQLERDDMYAGATITRIRTAAGDVSRKYAHFQEQQLENNMTVTPADKARLHQELTAIETELSRYLATVRGGEVRGLGGFDAWLRRVLPFHWCTSFAEVMGRGGFDVIVGNPPYVDNDPAKNGYAPVGFKTESCGDLYALVLERSLDLLRQGGRMAMIVPLSLCFSRDFGSLRGLLRESADSIWCSSFDNIPDRLFTGAKDSDNTSKNNQQRVTICVLHKGLSARPVVETTITHRWRASERARLFQELRYTEASDLDTLGLHEVGHQGRGSSVYAPEGPLARIGDPVLLEFLRRWLALPDRMGNSIVSTGRFGLSVPKTAGYYVAAYPDDLDRTGQSRLLFGSAETRDLALVVLNSNVFFWYWRVVGDCFHVTIRDIASCPSVGMRDKSYLGFAQRLKESQRECTVFKRYRGVDVPNVNYSKRMDILSDIDTWLIDAVAPDLGLTSDDFLWSKSNSCFVLQVPKAAHLPGTSHARSSVS